VQQWRDGSTWLENQQSARVSYRLDSWKKNSLLVFSVEHTQYNLAPYPHTEAPPPTQTPILPWDDDLLMQLSVRMPW
jgi:hypothetical protein